MKFMVSLITDESRSGEMTPQEMERMGGQMQKFMHEAQEAGADRAPPRGRCATARAAGPWSPTVRSPSRRSRSPAT
jgi:hypothetical protein